MPTISNSSTTRRMSDEERLRIWSQRLAQQRNSSRRDQLLLAAVAIILGSTIELSEALRLKYEDLEGINTKYFGPHILVRRASTGRLSLLVLEPWALVAIRHLSHEPIEARRGLILGRTPLDAYSISTWRSWISASQAAAGMKGRVGWGKVMALAIAWVEATLSTLETPEPFLNFFTAIRRG